MSEKYENDTHKSLKEYQEWVDSLISPDELSKRLEKLFKRSMPIRSIARERKSGLPVGAIVCGRPLYHLLDVLKYFRTKAEDENKLKMKELKEATNCQRK